VADETNGETTGADLPPRDSTWAEQVDARLDALEGKGEKAAPKAAPTKEDK